MRVNFTNLNSMQVIQDSILRKSQASKVALSDRFVTIPERNIEIQQQNMKYIEKAKNMVLPHSGKFVNKFI